MGRTGRAGGHIGPLHLPVEAYVHCPRGGLVPLRRCEACDLMHGSVIGERLEVLCAYPEPVPPIHLRHASGTGTETRKVGLPIGRDERGELRERNEGVGALIFESDWPEE